MKCSSIKAITTAFLLGTALASSPTFADQSDPPTAQEVPVAGEQPPAGAETPRSAPADGAPGQMDRVNLGYVKSVAVDGGKLLTSPLRWEPKDWMKFGLVIGGTATLFAVDREIRDFTQRNRNHVASGVASFGNSFGEPMYVFPAVGAYYLYGSLADDSKARRVSLLSLESLLFSGALTEGIKTVAGRHRPNSGDLPTKWNGPGISSKNVSFSSGHTANAFSLATVIAGEYSDTPYVAPAVYGLATLTALARIYKNEHWASDTLFGAAVGHFVSKAILSYHKKDKNKLSDRLSLVPQVGKELTGLTVSYKF